MSNHKHPAGIAIPTILYILITQVICNVDYSDETSYYNLVQSRNSLIRSGPTGGSNYKKYLGGGIKAQLSDGEEDIGRGNRQSGADDIHKNSKLKNRDMTSDSLEQTNGEVLGEKSSRTYGKLDCGCGHGGGPPKKSSEYVSKFMSENSPERSQNGHDLEVELGKESEMGVRKGLPGSIMQSTSQENQIINTPQTTSVTESPSGKTVPVNPTKNNNPATCNGINQPCQANNNGKVPSPIQLPSEKPSDGNQTAHPMGSPQGKPLGKIQTDSTSGNPVGKIIQNNQNPTMVGNSSGKTLSSSPAPNLNGIPSSIKQTHVEVGKAVLNMIENVAGKASGSPLTGVNGSPPGKTMGINPTNGHNEMPSSKIKYDNQISNIVGNPSGITTGHPTMGQNGKQSSKIKYDESIPNIVGNPSGKTMGHPTVDHNGMQSSITEDDNQILNMLENPSGKSTIFSQSTGKIGHPFSNNMVSNPTTAGTNGIQSGKTTGNNPISNMNVHPLGKTISSSQSTGVVGSPLGKTLASSPMTNAVGIPIGKPLTGIIGNSSGKTLDGNLIDNVIRIPSIKPPGGDPILNMTSIPSNKTLNNGQSSDMTGNRLGRYMVNNNRISRTNRNPLEKGLDYAEAPSQIMGQAQAASRMENVHAKPFDLNWAAGTIGMPGGRSINKIHQHKQGNPPSRSTKTKKFSRRHLKRSWAQSQASNAARRRHSGRADAGNQAAAIMRRSMDGEAHRFLPRNLDGNPSKGRRMKWHKRVSKAGRSFRGGMTQRRMRPHGFRKNRYIGGNRDGSYRIVNGYDAELRPWYTAIMMADKQFIFCGGSLISPRYVLTAAHCFKFHNKKDPTLASNCKNLRLIFGIIARSEAKDLKNYEIEFARIPAERADITLQKNPVKFSYDIALVKTKESVKFEPGKISPVCLEPKVKDTDVDGTVTGFGLLGKASKKKKRIFCWTDARGPSIFTQCSDTTSTECSMKDPPQPPDCQIFFNKFGGPENFINKEKADVAKVGPHFCYPVKGNGGFGWCKTNGTGEETWGFCVKNGCHSSSAEERDHIKETVLRIFPTEKCLQMLKPLDMAINPENEICGGQIITNAQLTKEYDPETLNFVKIAKNDQFMIGGSGTCQGDSGGPIVTFKEISEGDKKITKAFLIGIVSRGYSCAFKNHPKIFTRVTAHYDWIMKQIEEENQCSST